MSLILEALRKSEAERRRGEAPDLRVELPPVAVSRRRALPAWTLIAGAVLVLLLALAALWRGGSGTGAGTGADTDAAEVSEASASSGDGVVAAPGESFPAGPAVIPDTGAEAGNGDAFPHVDRITPTASAEPPAPILRTAPDPATAPPPATPLAGAPAAPPGPAGPAAGTAPRPESPAATSVPRITELSASQRQRLPAMKLSMHMWNEDPARRFVVIDGQRRTEGDRSGEATISAIDRDGVLLDLDERQVRVPLP